MFGKKNAHVVRTFGKSAVGVRRVTVDDSFDAHVADTKKNWTLNDSICRCVFKTISKKICFVQACLAAPKVLDCWGASQATFARYI